MIGERLGVARSVISVLLARLGPTPVQEVLSAADNTEPESTVAEPDDTETTETKTKTEAEAVVPFAGSARIGTGSHRCRNAGAMLLFTYLDLVGARAIFATLTGGPARRYGDLSGLTTATLGFALGPARWRGPSTCAGPRPGRRSAWR